MSIITEKKRLILVTAFILRIIVFSIPSVVDILIQRVELATPVTSFKRLTEGVYLYNHNVLPYDGGSIHQAPILLCLFSFIMTLPNFTLSVGYSIIDLIIAYALMSITELKQQRDNNKNKLKVELNRVPISPAKVALLYLFNPFTLLSCISKSTLIFTNLSIILSILAALKGKEKLSVFWISLASYFSLYPVMLLPPLILILNKKIVRIVGLFTLNTLILLAVSYLLTGSWDFIHSCYGTILFVSDLTPNIGMFWYFFIEIFDQFRSFFMMVFQFHTFIFATPITIKFSHQPLFALTILCGIMAIFKSYPSAADASLYLALVSVHDELFKYCRYGFLISSIFLYASVLAPIFWHLWIYAGSGNANFFYAITLVYNLGQVLLFIDLIHASLRRQFDMEHPESIGKHIIHK
ncbi:GPI transamidase subunit PIG-U [Pilobolus umbonatus]|nr:GPI transamidase subunit PIG-U [Pilobolus umbonatus]